MQGIFKGGWIINSVIALHFCFNVEVLGGQWKILFQFINRNQLAVRVGGLLNGACCGEQHPSPHEVIHLRNLFVIGGHGATGNHERQKLVLKKFLRHGVLSGGAVVGKFQQHNFFVIQHRVLAVNH